MRKVDPTKIEPMWRFMLRNIKDGTMAPGDFRNWDAIRAWARELYSLLSKA